MINPKESLLIIIDVQEKFRPVLADIDKVISNIVKLVKVFQLLEIPILVCEQYPKGLGETVGEIKNELAGYDYIEKTSFDCFRNEEFSDLLKKKYSDKKHLIICGIESHVCVFQSVISALSQGYNVYLAADAAASRKKPDYEIALRRIESEGAKPASTEMLIFQMIADSKHKYFKEISRIVR